LPPKARTTAVGSTLIRFDRENNRRWTCGRRLEFSAGKPLDVPRENVALPGKQTLFLVRVTGHVTGRSNR
jgi:hypothetical protein